MSALASSGALLFNALAGLYLLAVLLRFMLQIARADFYNPVSQAVVKITDPMVRIFRGFIPGYKGIDFSTLVLAMVIQGIAICVLILLYGGNIPGAGFVVTWAVVGTVYYIINIYYFAIFASIIASWIMVFSGNMRPHPLLVLVSQLTEPVMAPARKVLPPMGGMDFSPILTIIVIAVLRDFLAGAFGLTGSVAQVVLGV